MSARIPKEGGRVLITGASGRLGCAIRQAFAREDVTVVGLARHPGTGIEFTADILDPAAVRRVFEQASPEIIIHTAALADVEVCEQQPDLAHAINARATGEVARAAKAIGAHMVSLSTDYVFDGDCGSYLEMAPARPLSVYGRSKYEGECRVLDIEPSFAVVRTSWLHGGPGRHFPRRVLSSIRKYGSIPAPVDERSSPTGVDDVSIALACLSTLRSGGIFHLVNSGSASRYEFARAVAALAGYDEQAVHAVTRSDIAVAGVALRPPDSSLLNTRAAALGVVMRSWVEPIVDTVAFLVEEIEKRAISPTAEPESLGGLGDG